MSVSARRTLHRSTSSLELAPPTAHAPLPPSTPLRREFGSHGELHRPHHVSNGHSAHPPHPPHPHPHPHPHQFSHLAHPDAGDSFFAMLQNIKPTVTVDQRSPGQQTSI